VHNLIVSNNSSLTELSYTSNVGEEVPLSQFAGRPVLIVNTARKCGFAGQYADLERLHETYGPQGLVVLGFPCDQFAHQEPGSDEVIAEACRLDHGVTFPLSTKIEVNGAGTHPVFEFLKEHASGLGGSRIKWNFTKFLVAPDGTTVRRYAPNTSPKNLEPVIQEMLANREPASGS
jgi:glutathione peroxidase